MAPSAKLAPHSMAILALNGTGLFTSKPSRVWKGLHRLSDDEAGGVPRSPLTKSACDPSERLAAVMRG